MILMSSFMRSKEFLMFCHNVFDQLPISVNFLDNEGKIIYMNDAFLNFLQLSRNEVIGRLVTKVNPTSKFIETLENKRASIAQKHIFPEDKEAIVHRIPIFDEEGELVG